jgi:hypothetical protein
VQVQSRTLHDGNWLAHIKTQAGVQRERPRVVRRLKQPHGRDAKVARTLDYGLHQ